MKQILQNLKTGRTEVAEVPRPATQPGHLLIQTSRTLVSVGTERMLLNFGQASLLGKARAQPDRVRQAIDKIKTDGLIPTVQAVFNKLDQPLPLGYCNVGVVMEVGGEVSAYAAGERVISNGKHAQVVSVPTNLCAKVPDNISDDEAVFTVLAAVGLQGIRLVQPTLGEVIVVIGAGLVGLLTVQLLRAHGCRVLAIDFDGSRLALAKQFGAEVVDASTGADVVAAALEYSRGRGVDGVLITASTRSSDPVHQAALMCRKRGRIVMIGDTGLDLSRADFFEKELTFQVSCSYGPGRYDTTYENKGLDYPVGFVRWTEQRNFEAVLDMIADGRLDVKPLVSHRFSIERAEEAYAFLNDATPPLGILFDYPSELGLALRRTIEITGTQRPPVGRRPDRASIAFIGAGNYATSVLIPAFKSTGARMRVIGCRDGVSGVHAARKFGIEAATTDTNTILHDDDVNAVVICTRHDSHASLAIAALTAGKHVFVEKPLALSIDELAQIEAVMNRSDGGPKPILMVGFNRRFAPHTERISSLLQNVHEPKVFVMTVNAGAVPPNHWAHDPAIGGGRFLGEACHFVDLLRNLAGSPIAAFQAAGIDHQSVSGITDDRASITLRFNDGSLGTILYLANGHRSFPKERLEVFAGGRVLQLDNFRSLKAFGWPGFRKMNLWRQDKGQRQCATAFVRAVERGDAPPIPLDQVMEVSRVTLEISETLRA